ncbi:MULTISPECIES: beta-ketoacyl-[acyl-carrier-protein] synthase family protein [Amycolatopsis]|uniref:3-oxoacyl-[acyl-carrier-protein] synthase 2 n=2 Tax=Amycolatopsis TaxID=1813 RepID=A0A1I3XHG3_9PSEU|nr:beta-ketoacyl-[acyl-carrier-protein] synthase family protein [Amycolatopsis sacchari]SFK18511.1 3-oxoacyl-[acyl-carrier-protein] synthase II [Amycolatopsis sacchari]
MRRAVITGLGAISPVGASAPESWQGLLAGRSGIALLDEDWAEDLPTRLAARMAVDPATKLDRVAARRLDRAEQAALVAAREAWTDAGLDVSTVDPNRVAAIIGTGIGGVGTLLANHRSLRDHGPRRLSPRMVPMMMPNGAAAAVSIDLDARAGALSPVSACATGGEAIAHGLDLVRLGRADVVVAGSTEACVNELTMAGFGQARAMSTRNDEPQRASSPFDRARDGFVLGEGAAAVLIESEEHARARGRVPYATLAGAAITSDAHDMVAPEPNGDGQIRAMRAAVEDAGLSPRDIGHLNAHATSTPAGDVVEARAIRTVFGTHAPVVSAVKAMTGHLLGGAGSFEAVATVLALAHQTAPPTPTLADLETGLDIDVTRDRPRPLRFEAALSNSFGFGGHNTALVFTR